MKRAIIQSNEIELNATEPLRTTNLGKVYQGKCKSYPVFIEIIQKQTLSEQEVVSLQNQIQLIMQYNHPNVSLFLGVCEEQGCVKIVTEYVERSVETLLQGHNTLQTRLTWAKEAAFGISWLHGSKKKPVVVNLNLSKLRVDKSGRIKVTDFDFIGKIPSFTSLDKEQANNLLRNRNFVYFAPETVKKGEITDKTDVYSFGVILWELFTKKKPFQEINSLEHFTKILCEENQRPPFPKDFPNPLKELISSCWNANPADRPIFEQIISSLDGIINETSKISSELNIDKSIRCEQGRLFWKKHFFNETEVPWKEFVTALYSDLELSLPIDPSERVLSDNPSEEDLQKATDLQLEEFSKRSKLTAFIVNNEKKKRNDAGYKLEYYEPISAEVSLLYCLKYLLQQNNTVNISQFGKVVGWFGGIEFPHKEPSGFLNRVHETLSNPWFHGNISAQQAEKLLALSSRPSGYFLVRFSSRTPDGYCLSCLVANDSKRVVKHYVFTRVPGKGYKFENNYYPSLPDLVSAASKVKCTEPCLGSRHQWLFQ